MLRKVIVFCLITLTYTVSLSAKKVVNPLDYGLLAAKSGVERYQVLMKCHIDAIKNGYDISYKGIKSLYLEIPSSPQSIPLPEYIDFPSNITMKKVKIKGKRDAKFVISTEPFNTTNKLNVDVSLKE